MPIFQDVLKRLASNGWAQLFNRLGVDISANDFSGEMQRILDTKKIRKIPGFEDLSPAAKRAIEPWRPAESILFHALASPGVDPRESHTSTGVVNSNPVQFDFATPRELDIAENAVFGLKPRGLKALVSKYPKAKFGVVVFAREYRQKSRTVHRRHADMVFSRTGITRIGTFAPRWDGAIRSYAPFDNGPLREKHYTDFDFRAVPCRYAVYLAIKIKGDSADFGPYPFRPNDKNEYFWVPVHKLFSGSSCLEGKNIDITLLASHVDEKIRRLHKENMGEPRGQFHSGFDRPEIDSPPFIHVSHITHPENGIDKEEASSASLATFLDKNIHGFGTLSACWRHCFVEKTSKDQLRLGALVPSGRGGWGALEIPPIDPKGFAQAAPKYTAIRTKIHGGVEDYIGDEEDFINMAQKGGYTAGHYTDCTGDGWIKAICTDLDPNIDSVSCYSVIAPPDFYPLVDQLSLFDWSGTLPDRNDIWFAYPWSLSHQRHAANPFHDIPLQRPDLAPTFTSDDTTVTAMVGFKREGKRSETSRRLASYLPDEGAGTFSPGWDVGLGKTNGHLHLAAYGLGSPFVEDVKLCAVLSAFWPGVAPDTARSGPLGYPSVAPMTDREVGTDGAEAWDGVRGPRVYTDENGEQFVETDNFLHVDYVAQALNRKFTMVETMKVDQKAYQDRISSTLEMYKRLSKICGQVIFDKAELANNHRILSYKVDEKKAEHQYTIVEVVPPGNIHKVSAKSGSTPFVLRERIVKTHEIVVVARK